MVARLFFEFYGVLTPLHMITRRLQSLNNTINCTRYDIHNPLFGDTL